MPNHKITLLEALETIDRSESFGIPVRLILKGISHELRWLIANVYDQYGVIVSQVMFTKLIDWIIRLRDGNLASVLYVDVTLPSKIDTVGFTSSIQPFIEEFYIFQLLDNSKAEIAGEVLCSSGTYAYLAKKTADGYVASGEFLSNVDTESAFEFAEDVAEQYSYIFGDY